MKYIFLHIPKSAGTAFRESLMGAYKPQDVGTCYRIGKVVEDLKTAILENKKLIIGHINFGHLDQVDIPADYQLITVFRHPIERLISTYIHFQNHDNKEYSSWTGGKVSFEEFMQTEHANDWTTRFLTNFQGEEIPVKQHDEILAKAGKNLHRLAWVGVAEEFELSLFSLSVFLGKTLKHPGTVNKSADEKLHVELRLQHRHNLLLTNVLDILLYAEVDVIHRRHLASIKHKRFRKAWFNLRSGGPKI